MTVKKLGQPSRHLLLSLHCRRRFRCFVLFSIVAFLSLQQSNKVTSMSMFERFKWINACTVSCCCQRTNEQGRKTRTRTRCVKIETRTRSVKIENWNANAKIETRNAKRETRKLKCKKKKAKSNRDCHRNKNDRGASKIYEVAVGGWWGWIVERCRGTMSVLLTF